MTALFRSTASTDVGQAVSEKISYMLRLGNQKVYNHFPQLISVMQRARSSVVGWGARLQAGWSQFHFFHFPRPCGGGLE
jgi:hypothetical protein